MGGIRQIAIGKREEKRLPTLAKSRPDHERLPRRDILCARDWRPVR